MEGTIVNFRGGVHTQTGNQMVIIVDGVSNIEKAKGLVGKKVIWTSPAKKEKKEITGKITFAHGNKGAVRALFERGMPGQAVGQKVRIE